MTTYEEAKSVAFISDIIRFAEELLGIKFWETGKYSYSAHCPFHNDRKDSFRVYVNSDSVVRFHCFGCPRDCDVYELIELKRKCSFDEAQHIFADYLGIKDFVFYKRRGSTATMPEEQADADDPVSFIEPPEPDPKIVAAMEDAANFYNKFLLDNETRFKKVFNYLSRRGVDHRIIQDYFIGYSPQYNNETSAGRAMINHFMGRFNDDYRTFHPFYESGLIRLLNGDRYFQKYVDHSIKNAFSRNHADFFAGRIVFPVHNIKGVISGFVGRRPDNSKYRWLKQKGAFNAKSWLYGIDKAAKHIQQYRTVILVEGIFDYFAFLNIFQNPSRPIVISTLGSNLTDEAMVIFSELGVENFVIAFDWDTAGKKAILKAKQALGAKTYYLGKMEEGQDPAELLKDAVNAIDGFSLGYLMTSAKQSQDKSSKPIHISYITSGPADKRNVEFNPATSLDENDLLPVPKNLTDPVKDYYYNIDDFMPLLSYDHGNKAVLETKLYQLCKFLETKPVKPESDNFFKIKAFFISNEAYDDLGGALILWLWLVINQQKNGRRVVGNDKELGTLLKTSRQTFNRYKQELKELGYLNIKQLKKGPGLSVNYSGKNSI